MGRTLLSSGSYKVNTANIVENSAFESKYGTECRSNLVPYIVAPHDVRVNGMDWHALIGCPVLVIDNNKQTSTYAIVGDESRSVRDWNTMSLKCLWDLGYSRIEANVSKSLTSNFTVYIDTDNRPSYDRRMTPLDLIARIETVCQDSFGSIVMNISDTAYGNALSGQYTTAENINWDYLNYMIISIGRNTNTVPNYESLKQNNVAGVIIEAGYLYDSVHREVSYRNPKLDSQCRRASQYDMPFGLYCDSKARSVEEAKKELYQLSFCIRKYPPAIGMWVHFQLVKSKSINDSIINHYRDTLVRLGLKNQIGIIANDSELQTFSWKEKHSKDWALWWVNRIQSVSEITQLLTPQFFVV